MYPGDGDPAATPATDPEADLGSAATVTLDVDGETFSLSPDRHDGTTYTWLSGPNPGYGFGLSPTPDATEDEHRAHIRDFLAGIDPSTGYLREG